MNPTSDRIAAFLDDVVAGLSDDPELRLDVRAELAAHIDEAVERHRADGTPEDKAIDLALRSLGSPLEVAGDLQAANRGRMHMRGIARLALRGLVVPAAVIVGLLNVAAPIFEARNATELFNALGDDTSFFDWLPGYDPYGRRLDADQRLIVYGDLTRPTPGEQQEAIWDRYPDDPVYFGNYLTSCLNDESVDLEEVLLQGESLEPDNARFGYLRAAARLDEAASITNTISEGGDGADRDDALVIQDRERLDQALSEYVLAAEKPWMRRHSQDMLARRFDLLPEPTRYVDLIHRTSIAAAVQLPDLFELRKLSKVASLYAVQLADEGERQKAEPLLTAWFPMLRQIADDSFTLIDVLVISAIADSAGGQEIRVREQTGQTVLAEQASARMEAFIRPVEEWRERREKPGPELEDLDTLVYSRGSLLASILLPALGPGSIRPEELDANRWTEYVLMERISLAALSGFLLLILLVLAIVAITCRVHSAGRSIPILMIPPWRRMLKIVGIGVLAPLVLYALYSRCIPYAGRAYSFDIVRVKLVAELFLLGITIVLVTWISARGYVRDRCITYGLSIPRGSGVIRWLPAALLGLTWMVVLTAPVGPEARPAHQELAAGLAGLVGVAALVAGISFLAGGLTGRTSYRMYYGTMARSLIPVLAAAILVVGCVGIPWLSAAETRLIQQDMLMGPAAHTGGFTAPEMRLTENLLAEIRSNLKALDDEDSRL